MLSQLEAVVLAELEESGESPQTCICVTHACCSHIPCHKRHMQCSRRGLELNIGSCGLDHFWSFDGAKEESKKVAPASAPLCTLLPLLGNLTLALTLNGRDYILNGKNRKLAPAVAPLSKPPLAVTPADEGQIGAALKPDAPSSAAAMESASAAAAAEAAEAAGAAEAAQEQAMDVTRVPDAVGADHAADEDEAARKRPREA